MIRIISGVYGYVKENGLVVGVKPGDPPISIDPNREAELVREGVAEYIDSVKSPPVQENPDNMSDDLLYQMKKKDLMDYARSVGVTPDPRDTKESLIDRIHAAESEDEPPMFDAEAAIR